VNLRTISQYPDALYLETECEHLSIQDAVRELRMQKSIVTPFAQETMYFQSHLRSVVASHTPVSQILALISSDTLRSVHHTGAVLYHGCSVTQVNSTLLPSFLLSLLHTARHIEPTRLLVPVNGAPNYFFLFIEIIQRKHLHVQVATLDSDRPYMLYLEDGRTVDQSLYVGLSVQKLPSV
jgi:hypothetical protein